MLKILPCEFKRANEFVETHHRHHKKSTGHRFSIAAFDTKQNKIVGVAICGRPVARLTDPSTTLEVTRLCTDGTKNACSFLYSACARIGKEMGYSKIQTFILESEYGKSLEAAGWKFESWSAGGLWIHSSGPRNNLHPICQKKKYSKILNQGISIT